MTARTLNDAGGCTNCESKKFIVREELLTNFTLATDSRALVQDNGACYSSEIRDIECDGCGAVYDASEVGEIQFKPIGA